MESQSKYIKTWSQLLGTISKTSFLLPGLVQRRKDEVPALKNCEVIEVKGRSGRREPAAKLAKH